MRVWTAFIASLFAGVAVSPDARALTIEASLLAPLPGLSSATIVTTPTAGAPSQAYSGSGFSVSFQGLSAGQGLVEGDRGGLYATPIAGGTISTPTYLTGDYHSSLTVNAAQSGRYFSTGLTSQGITISFDEAETSLTLLWGSIDGLNQLDLYNSGTLVASVSGSQVQSLTAGFVSNGFRGFGGSAYVTLTNSNPFNTVVAHSGTTSFEFAGMAVSTGLFTQVADTASTDTSLPEPSSLGLLGGMLAFLVAVGFRHLSTCVEG
jgi:hypothetical protein